jgi:transcriptional regulator with XRE-family HTH domain
LKSLQLVPEPKTLGEHLKKRRLNQALLQRDVANQVGIAEDTYRFWETDRVRPEATSWKGIIEFLGYDPNPAPRTFAEHLRAKRRAVGLSQRELARRLGCHHSTIYRYEQDGSPPEEDGELLARLLAVRPPGA